MLATYYYKGSGGATSQNVDILEKREINKKCLN